MTARCQWPGSAVAVLACVAVACAQPPPGIPEPTPQGNVVAAVVLPPSKGEANVLRVTVTPAATTIANPTWQGSLHIEGERASAVPLPPWTLYPADHAATFVVRVPAPFVAASRAGRRVILSVRALSSRAGAAAVATAPPDIKPEWSVSGN